MSMNWFLEPIGWFAFFIGVVIVGNLINDALRNLGSKGKGKLQSRWGIIASLLFVGFLWFFFSKEIAALFDQVQQHAVQLIAILLVIIGLLVFFKRGS